VADLQFVVSALDKATAALLKITAQLDKVGDKLDKLDGKVAKLTVALDDRASPGLDNIDRKVKNLDGKKATVKVDVDKSLGDSLIKISLLGRALKAIALPAAAVAAAPQIAALGAAAVSATGAIGILPGAIGAAALAAGTAQVAFGGLIKYFTADSPKKQAEAYATLTDSGKKLADTIKGLTPQFKSLHDAVQNAALQGFADQVKPLAASYIPMLRQEMVKVAQGFNVAGLSLAKFFQQKNTVSDLQGAFMSMRIAVNNTIVALKPMAQAFTDIFVTSTARLPNLTKGIGEAAAKFAAFIKTARETGQLGQWIDKGVETVKLLGQTLGNVGSIILSVFKSATDEGANLVQTLAVVTGKMADFLKSAQGQNALKAVFGTIREAVAAVTPVLEALLPLLGTALTAAGTSLVKVFQALGPPLKDIANAVANALAPALPGIADAFGRIALALVPVVAPAQALVPAFHAIAAALAEAAKVAADFFTAMANTGAFLFKSIVPMITGLVEVFTGLLHIIEPLAPALGVIVAAFLAFKTASAGIGMVQGVLGALGGKIADVALNAGVMTEKLTGSANAGEKVATSGGKVAEAFGKVGAALPIIGIGIAAIGMAYEEFGGKADQAAAKVLDGSLSMQAAIAQEGEQIHRNQIEWLGGMNAQESYAAAAKNVTAEIDAQRAAMSPMQQLQSDVARAQANLNDAVVQFGPASSQAASAGAALAAAHDKVKQASQGAADAEKSLGDKVLDTQRIMAGAASADIGYQQSLLTLKEAESSYAQAVAEHGKKSDEAAQADLRLQQAHIDAANAAATKAEAEAKAAGVTDTSTIKAQAFKEELLRQAETMTGPSKQALIDLANGTANAGNTADTARLQSEGYRSQLDLLAKQADGPTKQALENTRQKLGEVANSHMTAQQKADAQRSMLVDLARQTTGPTHDAIMGMIHDLDSVPKNTSFTVTGTGVVGNVVRSTSGSTAPGAGHARGGILEFADGGVTPGYTPGRDVHTFRSATGGTLKLSGGEAVMRPEWTQAVGPSNVHRMNAAARSGGVTGARQYMSASRFADGGIVPGQSFASGGMVLTGAPFRSIPNTAYQQALDALMKTMIPSIVALVKAEEARIAAAAAAAAAFSGSVGLGGGDARSWIIAHESGGNPRAQNPTSSASGLYQFIDGTWRSLGGSTAHAKDASVAEQNAIADRYVAQRYGSWEGAKAFWISHGWYDRGGYLQPGMTMAMNNTGQPERVLSPAETRDYRGGDSALIAAVQGLRGELRALRGDVDHHSDNATIAGELRELRYQLAAGGSVAVSSQAKRTQSELGAWA